MVPFDSPLNKHLFMCALLNFLLCSITFGTLRAAPDAARVGLECGPLNHTVALIIFIRMFSIPLIVSLGICFKHLRRFTLMMDIYTVTILLCIEVMLATMQLTQLRCYESLKTDPITGTAIFVYAMVLLITVDTMRLIYFAISREASAVIEESFDDEIELLLNEVENSSTPLQEEPQRKKPTRTIIPAPNTPGL
jgi:hypothetical protein